MSAPGSRPSGAGSSTIRNQTPSTPLLFDNEPEPDGPPPSYEEAVGLSPTTSSSAPVPISNSNNNNNNSHSHSHSSNSNSNNSSNTLNVPGRLPGTMPGAFPSSSSTGRLSTSATASPSYLSSGSVKPSLPARPLSGYNQTNAGFGAPAPGSIPAGRQFPPAFNLYGDAWARIFTLGEHQNMPLYGVRMRSAWSGTNPAIALHNGPNLQRAPLLAAVDYRSLSDNMVVTLPPPLTYTGGSTAVALSSALGWTRVYRFRIEVGTTRANAHMETFEWRHSFGTAINALGGAHDGWKLVRMTTAVLEGGPMPARNRMFMTSDGFEVVAVWTDAVMSMTKQLKFAFIGTGLTGLLGERWSVMAVTSMLAIWDRESQSR